MFKRGFTYLDGYSIYVKLLAGGAALAGLVSIGVLIYMWAKITAFYDVIRTALAGFAEISPELSDWLLLPEVPLWPLFLLILTILFLMVTASLSFWALASYIDLKLSLAYEEREARALQRKTMGSLQQSLANPPKLPVAVPEDNGA